VVPNLGNGVIAIIKGNFAGVGPRVPPSGPKSKQTYDLSATIDSALNITLSGTLSGVVPEKTKILFKKGDMENPSGIYGGNTLFYLNGSSKSTAPGNDVYGWVGGDLFSGFNIGVIGSTTKHDGSMVGSLPSQSWFGLPTSGFFSGLQSKSNYYNQWAATLSKLSEAYNFAYTDRFDHVLVSLAPANADTLEIVLEDGTVKMG
jgi:hypothetical protein